jgi:flagellar motor switch protein FliM
MRQGVEAEPMPAAVRPAAEVFAALGEIPTLHLVLARALKAYFLATVAPRPLLALIERMLGAPAGSPVPAERALTGLEESLAKTVLARVLDAAGEAWPGLQPLGLELAPETTRHLPRIAAASDPVLELRSRIAVDGAAGDTVIIVPFGPLISALAGCAAGPEAARGAVGDPTRASALAAGCETAGSLLDRLADVDVSLTAEFTTLPLPLRPLLGLRAGDVIDTGVAACAPVDLRAGERRMARGRAGVRSGRIVVALEEISEERTQRGGRTSRSKT